MCNMTCCLDLRSLLKLLFAPQPQPPHVTKDQEAFLRSFSESLSCNGMYRKDAETLIHAVREFFEQRFTKKSAYEFSIDSTFYAGSFEKRTDVLAPDTDVTFRMNGSIPPAEKFKRIIEAFKRLLEKSTNLALINGTVKSTPYTVQFLMNNGIEVDLVPATRMTDANQIYEAMAKDPKNARYYRSSLIEYQVGFMKSQTPFAHAVARLGKLFLKAMYLGPDKFYAGSTIMELIGVAAAMEIEGSGSQSIFGALWRVLEIMEGIKNIQLAFKIVGISHNKDIWAVDKVPRMKGRYIIEPSDPNDNLLANKTNAVLTKVKKFATIMKGRLGQWGRKEITLRQLFDPYPMNIQNQLQSGPLPKKIYVSYTTYERTYLNVEVRNEQILMDPAKKKVFDILKQRVLCVVASLKHHSDHSSISGIAVKDEVLQLVKDTFPEGVDVFGDGSGVTPKLKTFDVTISYYVGDGKAVRVSVAWNSIIQSRL